MEIVEIDDQEYCGIQCLISGHVIGWDDEDVADAIAGSCLLLVVTSLCPEECAVGGLALSSQWAAHYAQNLSDEADDPLDELVESMEV